MSHNFSGIEELIHREVRGFGLVKIYQYKNTLLVIKKTKINKDYFSFKYNISDLNLFKLKKLKSIFYSPDDRTKMFYRD